MELKLDEDYAVVYMDSPTSPLRPLRATYRGMAKGEWVFDVHDPDDPLDFPQRVGSGLGVYGGWNEQMTREYAGVRQITWAEFAAEQLAHVKRQRELVERLGKVGIKRDPEPYTHRDRISNAVELSLVLNYDEISLLLRRGGA